MKKIFLLFVSVCVLNNIKTQCSLCTKTAQQLGPKAATGMNGGILYMMAIVFVIVFIIIYTLKRKKII